MNNIKIFTDGGSRGNPGPAACAFVVYDSDKEITRGSKYLGINTNNVAEYSGVLLAIDWLVKSKIYDLKTTVVNFVLDSELVVKQLKGIYKVKDEKMKSLHTQINDILKKENIKTSFNNVPRKLNHVADSLVNEQLDNQKI